MPYPDWKAGQRITAGLLRAGLLYEVQQGSDLTVTNSATKVDTGLSIPLEVGATYQFMALIVAQAPVANDFSISWTIPSGASMIRHGHGVGQGNNAGGATSVDAAFFGVANNAASLAPGGVAAGTNESYIESGYVICGSTAGVAMLQFAQRSVGAGTAAVLRDISRMYYQRVS